MVDSAAPTAGDVRAAWPEFSSVTGPVASGGQKLVYRAHLSGDEVALKLLELPVASPDEDDGIGLDIGMVLARWEREMRILQKCASPNLVRLMDWGPRVLQHEGHYFMGYAEEFLAGESLSLAAPLRVGTALRMVVDVCEGLRRLHEHPDLFIHRDVKPANIICGPRFVLVDPGIAFAIDEEDITRPGYRPPGTSGYMSPEQCDYFRRRVDLDGRSDVFSLGLTLVYALTGEHAYAGKPGVGRSSGRQQQAINSGRWRPEYAPRMPQSVVGLVSRMLGYRPHERFRTVGDVQRAARDAQPEVPDEKS